MTLPVEFSCPGKIFILGEYACLVGLPAIVTTLKPHFSLLASDQKQELQGTPPFNIASPAGQLFSRHSTLLKNIELGWHDPYENPIGVGSSSAQFILLTALIHFLESKSPPETRELLRSYWESVGESQGLRPSGLDVLSQHLGQTNWFSTHANGDLKIEPLSNWQHPQTGFLLAYTSKKKATHSHLQELKKRNFPEAFKETLQTLGRITREAQDAWLAKDATVFGPHMNAYQEALDLCDFAKNEFKNQIAGLQAIKGVYGCKGSGAQGGDCVILLIKKDEIETICSQIAKQGWTPFVPDWSLTGLKRTR